MGEGPITWQDIDAWRALGDISIEPWEAQAIRRMSSAFVSQRHESKKASCPAPYSTALPQDVRDKVNDQFKALVGALAGRKRG